MHVIRASLMPQYLVNTYYDAAHTVLNMEDKTDAAWILSRLRVWQKNKNKAKHRGSLEEVQMHIWAASPGAPKAATQSSVNHYNWAGLERVPLSQLMQCIP